MSEEFKVTLPKLGESIVSATIVQWFKNPGDHVRLDEPLLEVSTDKVNSEIPSPVEGVVKTLHAAADEELQVGDLLATISMQQGAAKQSKADLPTSTASAHSSASSEMKDFFSPALLRLAREKGIGLDELERIPATGAGGRLTKKDLEEHLDKRMQPKKTAASCPHGADGERVKMSGMRKAIADNMMRSYSEVPHASLITEIDITAVLKLISEEKAAFLAKHGVKLTVTSFVARAITRALHEYPLLNSSLEQDAIVLKRFVNLGLAVSVEQGLMVPVIKQCQRLGIAAIAKTINDLSTRAREGKLSTGDVSEGTITLTNFGMTGVQIGIPIIRYPEVAIVGIGAIYKKVVPLENDQLVVRLMMHICLTFDHRVLDGMYGCGFLGSLKKHLEEDLAID